MCDTYDDFFKKYDKTFIISTVDLSKKRKKPKLTYNTGANPHFFYPRAIRKIYKKNKLYSDKTVTISGDIFGIGDNTIYQAPCPCKWDTAFPNFDWDK